MNVKRDSLFYMANLGSEFSRVLKNHREGNRSGLESAINRARGILEILKTMPDMHSRLGELRILESILERAGAGNLEIPLAHLESYFVPFALRAVGRG